MKLNKFIELLENIAKDNSLNCSEIKIRIHTDENDVIPKYCAFDKSNSTLYIHTTDYFRDEVDNETE